MYRMGKKLETSNWKLTICAKNYVVGKEWHLLQAQSSGQGKMIVTGQGQELLLVNLFPIRRGVIIGKKVEV